MRKNLLSLTAALVCLATGALAQMSVPPGGTAVFTFDAQPTLADGWSTGYATGGGGDILDLTAMDAFAQTLTASAINTVFGSSQTIPPSANNIARWNYNATSGMFIQTRNTGIKCTYFMLTMRNDTGAQATTVTVQYDYATYNYTAEEIPGWRVYVSMDGAANSWIPVSALYPGNETPAHLSANIDLNTTPWAAGALMYLLWIDDNGNGQTDGSVTMDNFQVTPGGSTEFAVTVVPGNTTPTSVQRCSSLTFHAYVGGGTQPYSYQWMKDGGDLEGQTGSTLVLNNVQASDAGGYAVRVVDSSSPPGLVFWDPASFLEVTPNDTVPTAKDAQGGPDASTITVSFTKPVSVTGTIVVREVNTPANTLAVSSATVTNASNIVIVTSSPRELKNYEVVLQTGSVSDACNGSSVDPVNVPVIEHLTILPWNHVWSYSATGFEVEAGWSNTVYAPADSWPTGPGVFDGDTTPRTVVGGNTVGTQLPLAAEGSPYTVPGTSDIPTYYFRTHFTFPAGMDPAATLLTMQVQFDDAGIIFVNGREIFRTTGMTWSDTTEPFAVYSGTALGNGAITTVTTGASNFVEGDNVIAVYMKQTSATSSDETMGLQISAVVTNFFLTGGPLLFTVDTTPRSVPQCGTLDLIAVVQGGTRPYSMQWFHGATGLTDGGNVSGAATTHLIIGNVPVSDTGSYTLHVSDATPQSATSPAIPVTVVAETAPTIVSATGSTDLHTITVNFSTAINISSATGGDFLVVAEDGSGDLAISSSVVANNTEVVLVTTDPLQPKNYQVVVQGTGVTAPCSGLAAADGAALRITQKILIFGLDVNNEWQYNEAGVDLLTAWLANGYDDHGAGWNTGFAVLDGKRGAERTTLNGQTIRTTLTTTNATWPTTAEVIPTYYFRKHFTAPANMAEVTLSCRTFFDDWGILYINGQEAYRSTNIVATNEIFTSYLERNVVGDANFSPEIALPKDNVVAGSDNVFAVYLKQGSPGSSDVTMGLELIATVASFVTGPRLTIVNNHNGTVTVSWNPATGTLQQSTDLRTWSDASDQGNGTVRNISGKLFFRVR